MGRDSGVRSTEIGSLPSDWQVVPLAELVDPERRVTYGIVQPGDHVENGVPLIRGGDYSSGEVATEGLYHVDPEIAEAYSRATVGAGDLLLAIVGYVGQSAMVPAELEGANITQTTARIAIRHPHSNDFFLHYTKSHRFRREVGRYTKGSAQLGLNLGDVEKFLVPVPPVWEQQRIAAILSGIDDAIAATRKVIDQSKRVKEGLLQTLMTRGIGHTRFKETEIGVIPEAWELIPLPVCEERGLLELGRGEVISAKDIAATPGDYPVYSSSVKDNGEMGRYGKWMFDEELITWSIDGGGDLFYRPKHRFSVTNVGGYLRLLSDRLSYRFVHAALYRQHQRIRFDYQTKAHPSVIRTWYHVPIAPMKEQKQIEAVLNSFDGVLVTHSAILGECNRLKRGLRQDLLTGRVRVQPA